MKEILLVYILVGFKGNEEIFYFLKTSFRLFPAKKVPVINRPALSFNQLNLYRGRKLIYINEFVFLEKYLPVLPAKKIIFKTSSLLHHPK